MRYHKAVVEKIAVSETCRRCGALITYDLLEKQPRACSVCGTESSTSVDLSLEYIRALQGFIDRARSS